MEDEERMWTPGKRQMAGLGKKRVKNRERGLRRRDGGAELKRQKETRDDGWKE